MKINLKYLVLSILIPLSVMASDPNGDLPEGYLKDTSCANRLETATPCSGQSVEPDSPTAIASIEENDKPSLTFKEARHEWCFGGEAGQTLARPILHYFFEQDDAKAFIIARHLWRLGNLQDKAIAENYFKTICTKEKHAEYDNLIDYFKTIWLSDDHPNYEDLKSFLNEDEVFKNKLGNAFFKYLM